MYCTSEYSWLIVGYTKWTLHYLIQLNLVIYITSSLKATKNGFRTQIRKAKIQTQFEKIFLVINQK